MGGELSFRDLYENVANGGRDPLTTELIEMRAVRTLNALMIALMLFGGVFALRYAALGVNWVATVLVLAVSTGGTLLLYLRRGGPVSAVAHGVALLLYSVLLVSNITSGGFYDPNMGWLYVVPVVAGLMIDRRAVLLYGALTLLTFVGFFVAEEMGMGPVDLIPDDQHAVQSLSNHLTAVLALCVLVGAFLAERDQSHQRLRDLLAEAQSANQAKSTFLANISHEIRTPMSGVVGIVELLQQTELDERQASYAETISQSSDAVLVLIDDLLDLSKIEAGALVLHPVNYDPRALFRAAVGLLEPSANHKNLELTLQLDAALPSMVVGDDGRLRQVVLNLVGNALKFTEQGTVSVEVRVPSVAPPRISVHVRDTGIGIPPEAHSGIFDPFEQADASVTRTYGGTGLGLSICRQVVEMMGGEIHLESRVGQGSHFWFEIPLEAGHTAQPEPEPTQTPPPTTGHMILVVDDNPVNRLIAQEQLRSLGHRTVLAESGHEALERVAEQRFDLILLDCQMPEMDGYEVTRRMLDHGIETPIVALTAHAMAEERQRCLEVGMKDMVSKPMRLHVLEEVLDRWTTWLPDAEQ